MPYLVTYQPARHPSDRVPSLLTSLGDWFSPTPMTYLLQTSLSATSLLNRLKAAGRTGDSFLIMELGKRYATNLPEGSKEWLHKYLR